VNVSKEGKFKIVQKLAKVTVLGVGSKPKNVKVNGKKTLNFTFKSGTQELIVEGLSVDLNSKVNVEWK